MPDAGQAVGLPFPIDPLRYRPRVAPSEAAGAAGELWGLQARATPLSGERDANFLLEDRSGDRFVLKVSSASERPERLGLQHDLITRTRERDPALRLPEAVPTRIRCVAGTTRFRRTRAPGSPVPLPRGPAALRLPAASALLAGIGRRPCRAGAARPRRLRSPGTGRPRDSLGAGPRSRRHRGGFRNPPRGGQLRDLPGCRRRRAGRRAEPPGSARRRPSQRRQRRQPPPRRRNTRNGETGGRRAPGLRGLRPGSADLRSGDGGPLRHRHRVRTASGSRAGARRIRG